MFHHGDGAPCYLCSILIQQHRTKDSLIHASRYKASCPEFITSAYYRLNIVGTAHIASGVLTQSPIPPPFVAKIFGATNTTCVHGLSNKGPFRVFHLRQTSPVVRLVRSGPSMPSSWRRFIPSSVCGNLWLMEQHETIKSYNDLIQVALNKHHPASSHTKLHGITHTTY